MVFIPMNPDRIPQFWGIPVGVVGGQTSVPDGPHEWVKDGISMKCTWCEIVVYVGTADPQRTLRRLAGVSCRDVLAMQIMDG